MEGNNVKYMPVSEIRKIDPSQIVSMKMNSGSVIVVKNQQENICNNCTYNKRGVPVLNQNSNVVLRAKNKKKEKEEEKVEEKVEIEVEAQP